MTSGEKEGRFGGVCRVKVVGFAVDGIPTVNAGSYGLRGRSDPRPAAHRLDGAVALGMSEPRLRFFEVLGSLIQASTLIRRLEHLFIAPARSSRRSVSSLNRVQPVDRSDEVVQHTLSQLGGLPLSSPTPKGYGLYRSCPRRWLRPTE